MILKVLIASTLTILCVATFAAERPEIFLWPQGMPPPAVPSDPAEKTEKGADGITRRWNVSRPRMVVYAPSAGIRSSGAGVLVIPGGGFGRLADEHEGSDACEWLAKLGAVAFQLIYRTPTTNHAEPNAGPVQDAQRAISLVRERASEFNLDPQKIGALGFSAGGQIALVAATNERRFSTPASSYRHQPDFLLLIYPYNIYMPATKSLRRDINLDAGLPPTFIAQMGDDPASLAQGSALFYLELLNRKIPAEIHSYERGGHGFGLRPRPNAIGPTDWPLRAADWMRLRGYAAGADRSARP